MAPNSSAQPSPIRIRTANENDAPGILQCLAAAFEPYRNDYSPEGFSDTVLTRETLDERLKHMHMLVAVTDDQIVGTIGAAEHGDEGHIRGMAVLPEWHGKGVAAQLLSRIEEWLCSRGCRCVTLDTTLPLKTAMRFYERNGYRRSGKISDFFGMTLVEYMKEL